MILPHGRQQLRVRGIPVSLVDLTLRNPDQRLPVRAGREVFQRRFVELPGAVYSLVRVFVDVDRTPPEVVTAYRTSKVGKYWRSET